MTSPPRPDAGHWPGRRERRPIRHLLGVVLPTAVLTALTLSPGSPPVPGFDLGHGSINYDWWLIGFLLVLPVYTCARAHPKLAIVASLVAGVAQFVIVHTYLTRSAAAAGSLADDVAAPVLAIAVYIQATFMTLLFAAAAACGALAPTRPRAVSDRFFV